MSGKSSTFRITLLGFFSARLNLPLWQEFVIIFFFFRCWFLWGLSFDVHISYKDRIGGRQGGGFFMDMGGFVSPKESFSPESGGSVKPRTAMEAMSTQGTIRLKK